MSQISAIVSVGTGQKTTRKMIDTLLTRIREAQAVTRLSSRLAEMKASRNIRRNAFRATGSTDELFAATKRALSESYISINDIVELVDEIEENGGQHIFPFEPLSTPDIKRVERLIKENIPERPQPTESYYATTPSLIRVHYELRDNNLIVKLVGKTDYWVLDKDASEESKDTQITVRRRKESRVVHLLIIDVETGLAEVRIQHASNEAPKKQWEKDLNIFLDRIKGVVTLEDLTPSPIWKGFPSQVANLEETYMVTDEAADATTLQSISLRRQRGEDIRNNEDYHLNEQKFMRKSLNIYWIANDASGSESTVYTNQQVVNIGEVKLGKVWISRHISPDVLAHVLDRIRKHAA